MSEHELAELEAHLTDGEPLISATERTYIADIHRLLAEVRRLRGAGHDAPCPRCGELLFCPHCGLGGGT